VNRKQTVGVMCVIGVLCLSERLSWAQQAPPGRGGRGAAGAGQALTPVELERWLDSYVLIQAQDALKITEAQFPRFLQRLNALQATRRRNAAARRQILATIGRQVRATPVDEAGTREQLKALRELDQFAQGLRRARRGARAPAAGEVPAVRAAGRAAADRTAHEGQGARRRGRPAGADRHPVAMLHSGSHACRALNE
jgi:hypothetical protein